MKRDWAAYDRTCAANLRFARQRIALLLGVFFASLYLLTMGGHLDSPDEELMFQVTRSLAQHGSMDIGNAVGAEHLELTGLDGRQYVPYGPVSSLISVPFYVLGQRAAALLEPRYTEVVERFAVGLRDPLMSAAECVLVYAVAIELSYGSRVGVLLSLAFGAATLAWPYSKYAWSEPVTGFWLLLSVLAAMRTVRSASPGWSALTGVALGLAAGSKITAGIAAPAVLVYILVGGTGSPGERIRRCTPCALMLALPALGLAVLNAIRFGNPLETGYQLDGLIDISNPIGIAGFLVSPGKSLFVYAPIALLGLVGLRRLVANRPSEAALLVWLVASHVVVYGVLSIWHGDAAWGPRYLVPVVPFMVLPAGAALAWTHGVVRQLSWAAYAALMALGVLVNLGGVLVDQRVAYVYLINAAGGAGPTDAERWAPRLSPVLIHWTEFGRRLSAFVGAKSLPASIVSGMYAREPSAFAASPIFPRWTSGAAVFDLKTHDQPVQLTLVYLDNRPPALGPAVVQIVVNGSVLPESEVTRTRSTVALPDNRFPWTLEARLDDAVVGRETARVEIRSQTWRPARDAPPGADIRDLGIEVWDLHFRSGDQAWPIAESPLSPMPVTDTQPWSFEIMTWFYTPPHLVDIWLWYLFTSGLPHWFAWLALAPGLGLIWSGVRLSRAT